MKISDRYNNFTFPCTGYKPYTPCFGISFKMPKLVSDIFVKQNIDEVYGIMKIKKVHSGKFGTMCKNSIPLKNFEEQFDPETLDKLYKRGLSTNTEGWSDCFLKSGADNPLSTSSVYDCSVMYLFNKDTNTHFLYHSYYKKNQDEFDSLIKTFMPEGFSKAEILAGSTNWYLRHAQTLPEMLKALRGNNARANINVCHYSSKMPEVVGYKGDLFEIPNRVVAMGGYDKGQASFKVCDLKAHDLLYELEFNATSLKKIALIRQLYEQEPLDKEVVKIINRELDKYMKKLLQKSGNQL